MWRSVFLHEFLDTNIRNFQALAGNPTPDSLMLTPAPSPPMPTYAVHITPGRGFEYILDQPLDQVIGVSGTVRIKYPAEPRAHHPVSIMKIGDIVEFRIGMASPVDPAMDFFSRPTYLRIGQFHTELGTLSLWTDRFHEIRFDWHSSGQARLMQDGKLVGYQNAAAPGVQLNVGHIVLGKPAPEPGRPDPNYLIGKVLIRVLRRPDPLIEFSRLLPQVPFPDQRLFQLCHLQTIYRLLAMGDQLRQFMSLIHQKLSQPWSAGLGPAEGPFQQEAIEAHRLATQAVVDLVQMMRTGDFSKSHVFLESFEKFLRILHDVLPTEFTILAEELSQSPITPEECSQLFQTLREENMETLGPLLDVLSKANDRIKNIAGGF
jgi:hypothetical protein